MSALDDKPFPKAPLMAAFLLVGACVAAVGATRLGFLEAPAPTSDSRAADITAMRDLRFADQPDGAVRVSSQGEADRAIAVASGGFVRGVLRGLVRERRLQGIGDAEAFRVVEWSDGAVTIEDLATHRVISLNAFGLTNRQAFVDLIAPLPSPAGTQA